MFADDQVIFSNSEDGLQIATNKLLKVIKDYNLKISLTKTKAMGFLGTRHLRTKIVIEDKIIEQVSSFNYLGCNVSYCENNDVNNKINKFQRMCGTIKRTLSRKTLKETQLKFYKVMAVPVLMYGSENWALTRSERRRIEAAEMRFLRSVAGYTLLDQKRSTDIRTELEIFNLNDRLTSQKKNWKEHILRMNEDRFPKKILNYRPEGRRNVGRPRNRWEDTFQEEGTGHQA